MTPDPCVLPEYYNTNEEYRFNTRIETLPVAKDYRYRSATYEFMTVEALLQATAMSAKDKKKPQLADSVGRATELLSDRWTFLILREAYFGTKRFNEFANALGVSRNILTDRLRVLVTHGLLEQHPYGPSGARHEYRLAEPGRDLYPAIVALLQWGDKYLVGDEGPSVILEHTRCGKPANPRLVCDSCGEKIEVGEVLPLPGPGAPDWLRERLAGVTGGAFAEQPKR